ncbi:MAG: DUF692 domain-containing protein [Alphaproteobacteria bacterium]
MIRVSKAIPSHAGIGLRFPHFDEILEQKPNIPWLEVHPENFKMGSALKALEKIRETYPLSLHGVGLSLGSEDLDQNHLKFLKSLIHRLEPGLVSEHVSWVQVDGVYLNGLMPLPYTDEAFDRVAQNIEKTQDFLGCQILIENPSTYMEFPWSTVTEWEFMTELAERTGCKILLDLNNIFISCTNHNWPLDTYLNHVAQKDLIGEIHLAGYDQLTLPNEKNLLIDGHSSLIDPKVWAIYEKILGLVGPVPTLIEWDTKIPVLSVLLGEQQRAQAVMDRMDSQAKAQESIIEVMTSCA